MPGRLNETTRFKNEEFPRQRLQWQQPEVQPPLPEEAVLAVGKTLAADWVVVVSEVGLCRIGAEY